VTTNIELIKNYLLSDSVLAGSLNPTTGYSGLAKGGVWDRRLKREKPGNTPTAFEGEERAYIIRPSVVVRDSGDTPHRQEEAIPTAYNQVVHIYFFAMATQSGKDDIAAMRQRVYQLLDHKASQGWVFTGDDGIVRFMDYAGRVGVHDSEIFKYRLTSRHFDIA
jgi:hypothetical protein